MTSKCCSTPMLGRRIYLKVYFDDCPAIVVFPVHFEDVFQVENNLSCLLSWDIQAIVIHKGARQFEVCVVVCSHLLFCACHYP